MSLAPSAQLAAPGASSVPRTDGPGPLAAGELVAMASHELKNPLGVIRMGAQLVRERLADHPAAEPLDREVLDTVCRAAARMERLVRDLLDLAQAGGGRVPFRPAALDVAALLDEACTAARLAAAARTVTLHASCGARTPAVWADRDRVGQVLVNLVDNAVKYAPGGTAVVLRAEAVHPAARASRGVPRGAPGGDRLEADGGGRGSAVRIGVADAGPGLPPGVAARVFDAFWRGPAATAAGTQPALPGHGLGLAIAKHLTEAQGGQIGVAAAAGGGCEFWVILPGVRPSAPTG